MRDDTGEKHQTIRLGNHGLDDFGNRLIEEQGFAAFIMAPGRLWVIYGSYMVSMRGILVHTTTHARRHCICIAP